MTKNTNELSGLAKALLETAKDMSRAGMLTKSAHNKITLRHLDLKETSRPEPLTGEKIRAIREKANMSQAAFAQCLNLSAGYISQLERNIKRPTGAVLTLLNVIHRKGIEAIL